MTFLVPPAVSFLTGKDLELINHFSMGHPVDHFLKGLLRLWCVDTCLVSKSECQFSIQYYLRHHTCRLLASFRNGFFCATAQMMNLLWDRCWKVSDYRALRALASLVTVLCLVCLAQFHWAGYWCLLATSILSSILIATTSVETLPINTDIES